MSVAISPMTTCSEARQNEDVLAPETGRQVCVTQNSLPSPRRPQRPHAPGAAAQPAHAQHLQPSAGPLSPPARTGGNLSFHPAWLAPSILPTETAGLQGGRAFGGSGDQLVGNPALLGVPFLWYGTVKTNIRYTDWTHLSLPETLHGSPLLLGQTPEPEPTSPCVAWHCPHCFSERPDGSQLQIFLPTGKPHVT